MFKRLLFLGAVKRNGFTLAEVAKKLGINETTLYRKSTGVSDFTRAELQELRVVLGLTADEANAIFFGEQTA